MFRSIALGGGGVRGGMMIGGLAALEKHQPLVFLELYEQFQNDYESKTQNNTGSPLGMLGSRYENS